MLFNYLLFKLDDYTPIVIYNKKIIKYSVLERDPTFYGTHKNFLSKRKKPYFYFCGTHSIPMLETIKNTPIFKKLKYFSNIDFYFYEPLTHYDITSNKRYVPHVLHIDNEPYEIANIRSKELDSISKWADENKITNLRVFCTDYKSDEHYQPMYSNLKLKCVDVFSVAHADACRNTNQFFQKSKSEDITKKFICLSWRYDIVRHMFISYLAEKDILKDSNVSFMFKVSNKVLKSNIWTSWRETSFKHPEFLDAVLNGNEKLQNLVPLSLDAENPIAVDDQSANASADPSKNILHTHCPHKEYNESCISLILESRFAQPWPNISEKTLNAILLRKPFIILGAPGTLSMLHDMGFKTFNEFWDESYDKTFLNTDRLVSICDLVEKLSAMSIEEMRSMYENMDHILEHNFKNIKKIEKFYKRIAK